MEVLKNVLIKEVTGGKNGDLVVYVDNLPKSFLYRQTKKMFIDPNDPQQKIVPEYEVVDGRRKPTNAMVDELLPGIETSPTGDKAFVFFTNYNEAKARLADIDRYIKNNVPVAERVQERVFYALQPGVMTSGTIPLQNIPRVVLPEPVSPPEAKASVQVEAHTAALPVHEPVKEVKERRPMTEAQKDAARERMARAREIRRQKQTGEMKA